MRFAEQGITALALDYFGRTAGLSARDESFEFMPHVQQMRFVFDLSQYDEVKANAQGIYDRLADGSMPCDGAWAEDRIALFRQWMDVGYSP